jgi:hypothetical protein
LSSRADLFDERNNQIMTSKNEVYGSSSFK